MDIGELYLFSLALLVAWMTCWYLISLIKKDASIIDIAWGYGVAFLSIVLFIKYRSEFDSFKVLLPLLLVIWGIRLGGHILIRKIGRDEDWRYKEMRRKGGDKFWLTSYFKIFLLQASLQSVLVLPLIVLIASPNKLNPFLLIAGVLVWSIGFIFEAIGDYQLTKFLSRNKNKKSRSIMKEGLWRFTRHPNYFGEITMWWGVFIIVSNQPYAYLAILSPLLISFLLLKVSGITMLEAKYKGNKDYQLYQKTTSAIFPLPPKR